MIDELEKYKEAYRLVCHSLILAQNLVTRDIKIVGEDLNFTKEYFETLEETQKMFLDMAEKNLE